MKATNKRLLSMLLTLSMMFTMLPAALAEGPDEISDGGETCIGADCAAYSDDPGTIALPNGEVREIPSLAAPEAMTASVSALEQDSEGYYLIEKPEDMSAVSNQEWYANYKFRITADLDLSSVTQSVAPWSGLITYFYGTLEGVKGDYDGTGKERYPMITGIPNNTSFIYGIIGGTIKNLTFHHDAESDGAASFITFMPTNYAGGPYRLNMEHVTVTGSISLSGSDQSNYSPFIYAAPSGGLTMTNCVNQADISGSIYGGIFCGYRPIYTGAAAPYVFDGCQNTGNVHMQYAGMFFGNSSALEGQLSKNELYLTIQDCVNNGSIRGSLGAKYFASPVAEFGANMASVESVLNPAPANTEDVAAAPTLSSPLNLEAVSGTGSLCVGPQLSGFAATLYEETSEITVTRPADESDVDHYTVSVGAYVNLWYPDRNNFYGTDRFMIIENIQKSRLSESTFTPSLKAYGLADTGVGKLAGFSGSKPVYRADDNQLYFWISNEEFGNSNFSRYVSNEKDASGQPAGGGTKAAELVTVAAYDSSGAMLDIVTLLP